MDNDFGDENELRQARSRRRFQTALLIFLLVFFMDGRTPQQEAQNQNRRAAQKKNAKRLETMGKTVQQLAADLERVPHGPSYALRDSSIIEGEWYRSDGEEFRTVVPAMDKNATTERKSKPRPDYGDEVTAPSKTGTVSFAKSRMTASLIPVEGKKNPEVSTIRGTLSLGKDLTRTSTDALFEGLFFHKYGHMSAVVGASGEMLKVVWDATPGTSIDADADAAAAGASPEESPRRVPTPADDAIGQDRFASGAGSESNGNSTASAVDSAGDVPVVEDGSPASNEAGAKSSAGKLSEEAPEKGGGGESDVDEEDGEREDASLEVEKEGDEDGQGRRGLTGLIVGAQGVEETGDGGVYGGWTRTLDWFGRWSRDADQAAAAGGGGGGARGERVGGWFWSEEEEEAKETDSVEGMWRRGGGRSGGRAEGSERRNDRLQANTQRHRNSETAAPLHERHPATFLSTPSNLFSRNLEEVGTATIPPDSGDSERLEPSEEAPAGEEGDTMHGVPAPVELNASMADEGGKDEKAEAVVPQEPLSGKMEEGETEEAEGADGGGGTVLIRDFPAMVLPHNAMMSPGQRAGDLPSQWNNAREEYGQGCLFLLTLQTVEDENEDVDGVVPAEGGEEANARKPLADLMTGEMVGVNCNFSAVVELKFSPSVMRPSTTVGFSFLTMLCLLQMCLLCCRVGLMLVQRRYGQHFMVPRRFQPPKFDYHRPIPPELLAQAGTETAGGQPSEETRDVESGNLLECAICYAMVDSTVEDYMLTPCDHVFHQGCLTRWMDIKMECPTCRRELPPQLER